MQMRRDARKHQTLAAQQHEGVHTQDWWEYSPEQRVLTIDGPGRVVAVYDGPHPGAEEYEITLEGGLGGGRYSPGQIAQAAQTEASVEHLASDDYPELGTLLHDRPDPATMRYTASLGDGGGGDTSGGDGGSEGGSGPWNPGEYNDSLFHPGKKEDFDDTDMCAVGHEGTCEEAEHRAFPTKRTSLLVRMSMPSRRNPEHPEGFHSKIEDGYGGEKNLKGYIGDREVGYINHSLVGRGALKVNMLHTTAHGTKGVASAMMDHLYSKYPNHLINHGYRTTQGLGWWNNYDEPDPSRNIHNLPPEKWAQHFHPGSVADDIHRNEANDPGHHSDHHDVDWIHDHDNYHYDSEDYDDEDSKYCSDCGEYGHDEGKHEREDLPEHHGGVVRLHPSDHAIVHDTDLSHQERAEHFLRALPRARDLPAANWHVGEDHSDARRDVQREHREIPADKRSEYTGYTVSTHAPDYSDDDEREAIGVRIQRADQGGSGQMMDHSFGESSHTLSMHPHVDPTQDETHKALRLQVSPASHRALQDPSIPTHERAQHLMDLVGRGNMPTSAWTTDKDKIHEQVHHPGVNNSAKGPSYAPNINVVLHAKPFKHEEVHDEDGVERFENDHLRKSHEVEFAPGNQATNFHLKGISWNSPGGSQTHHTFGGEGEAVGMAPDEDAPHEERLRHHNKYKTPERPVGIPGQGEQQKLFAALAVGNHQDYDKNTVYLRFGDWPKNERSANNITGHPEEGVSVYDLDHKGDPVDPDAGYGRGHEHDEGCEPDCDLDSWNEDYGNDTHEEMNGRVQRAEKGRRNGRDFRSDVGHLVRGHMVGVGHDGEPLLNNVKRVGDWIDHKHLFFPGAEPHHLARDPFDEDYEPPKGLGKRKASYDEPERHDPIDEPSAMHQHLIEHHGYTPDQLSGLNPKDEHELEHGASTYEDGVGGGEFGGGEQGGGVEHHHTPSPKPHMEPVGLHEIGPMPNDYHPAWGGSHDPTNPWASILTSVPAEADPHLSPAHLSALIATAAMDPSFRFHVTAAWRDVQAKAKRIRAEGGVNITLATDGMVVANVQGDHHVYETGLQRVPGKRQSIATYSCGCKWGAYHWGASDDLSRFAGRMCSHALALQYEAQSRGMFGHDVTMDVSKPRWVPNKVVVKYDIEDRDNIYAHSSLPDSGLTSLADAQHSPDVPEQAPLLVALALLDHDDPGLPGLLAAVNDLLGDGTGMAQEPSLMSPVGPTVPWNKDENPTSAGGLAAAEPSNWGRINAPSMFPRVSTLNEEPEGALPETDGEDHTASLGDVDLVSGSGIGEADDDALSPEDMGIMSQGSVSDIVAEFQRSAAAQQIMAGSKTNDDSDIARAAEAHLAKVAAFTAAERSELIDESPGTQAGNTDRLDIAGTHYAELEALGSEEDDMSWLM